MKKTQSQFVLLLTLSLTSCTQAEDSSSAGYLEKSNVKAMIAQVHKAYLQCYPLNESEKERCLNELEAKYIIKTHKDNQEYAQSFHFEAEKLGFKHFLTDHNFPCDQVTGGPIFDASVEAYTVTCKPHAQYQMQYNYTTKEWSLYLTNDS